MKPWLLLLLSLISLRDNPHAFQYEVVVVEQGGGLVTVLDPQSGARSRSAQVGNNPHEIAIASGGRFAYVSNFGLSDKDRAIGVAGDSVSVVDLSTMTERMRIKTAPFKAPHGVKLRPPGEDQLYVNVEQGDKMLVFSMLVFSTSTGRLLRQFDVPAGAHNFVFSPNGKSLFLMASLNGVVSVDPDTGKLLQQFKDDGPIRGLTWTADGKQLLASGSNKLMFLNPLNLAVERSITNIGVGQIIYSAMTPDGKYILAPCPLDQKVLLIDNITGKVIATLTAGKDPIAVQIAPGGRSAYVSNGADDHLTTVDLSNFEIRSFGKVAMPNGLGFRLVKNHRGIE